MVSTDGLLGKEAKILLKKPSIWLTENWEQKPTPKFANLSMPV
jgi:hypothetical protein